MQAVGDEPLYFRVRRPSATGGKGFEGARSNPSPVAMCGHCVGWLINLLDHHHDLFPRGGSLRGRLLILDLLSESGSSSANPLLSSGCPVPSAPVVLVPSAAVELSPCTAVILLPFAVVVPVLVARGGFGAAIVVRVGGPRSYRLRGPRVFALHGATVARFSWTGSRCPASRRASGGPGRRRSVPDT